MSVIILQGNSDYSDQLHEIYGDDCIFSTWVGAKSNFKYTIRNIPPENTGVKNCNLQLFSTYAGCLLAKELGYSQVLKVRSDILIKDWKLLLTNLDLNCLNFFSWHNWDGGYYVDYIFGGPVDEVIEITKDLETGINEFPERRITKRVNKQVKYVLPILINYNIACYSLKWNKNLTDYCKKDNLFVY